MPDTVEQVKSRLDVVDVISGYIKLQRAGANWKARCPFHNEKTPSFHVSPERQSWHCFGCNKGGDFISFVQEIEGVEFIDALRMLATKAGVAMPERHERTESGSQNQRAALLAVAELSAKFFEKQLWHSTAGAKALAYLRERGLADDTIRAWRLGWAPNDWRALSDFLQKQKYASSQIVASGVCVQKTGNSQLETRNSLYDRFRSRIMFPICDATGRVAGFTGRAFGATVMPDGAEPAKYVNTPQTSLYDKSRILFGLDKAKLAMRQKDQCLVVEGNVDAILSWQAGAANVVATSGTALTPQQLTLLGRYSKNLAFCFDADQAGQAAARRGIGLALAGDFSVRMLTIPDPKCKDPADYVAVHGVAWNEVIAQAQPVMEYYYHRVRAVHDPSSEQSRRAAIASLGPLIRHLASRVERDRWMNALASLLQTTKEMVLADLALVPDDIALSGRTDTAPTPPAHAPSLRPIDPVSLELLALVVAHPAIAPHAAEAAALTDERIGEFLREPERLGDASHVHRHIVDMASMRAEELWQNRPPDELQAYAAGLVARLQASDVRKRRARLEPQIREAEAARDTEKLQGLMREFQEQTNELTRLQSIQASSPNPIP